MSRWRARSRVGVVTGGVLVGFLGTAAAEVPGPFAVASVCGVDPDDACWDDAPVLARFAPAPGLLEATATADVRLAWHEDGLLVRIDTLPSDSWVEVGLARKAGDVRLSRAEPGVFKTPGVHLLRPGVPLEAGEVRRLWLTLVTRDGAGAVVRPWAPAGPADPDHPARVLFAELPAPGLPLELSRTDTEWRLGAAAGDELRLTHLRPAIPGVRAEMPDPWAVTGQGELATPVPEVWGWVEAAAVWRDADGVAVDLQSIRAWSEPAGPPDVSADSLFFPPVKSLAIQPGRWRLPSTPTVCGPAEAAGVGALVVRELTRVTGHAARWQGTSGCDIELALGAPPVLDDHPEGFALAVGREGATVHSPSRLGLTYGALALVDALGPQGRVPRMTATDWPTIPERPLYHSINLPGRPDLTVDTLTTFVERTVLRGRYDQLHLLLSDGIDSPSAPELSHRRHWRADTLAPLKQLADDVGLTLVPAVNAPGHSAWMLRSHPELADDVHHALLDVRHPEVHPLLDRHYADVLAAFDGSAALHIGHDEVLWQSQRWFGDERNPRTSSTPRSILLAEDLRWHLDWCRERGLKPYVWTDMLLADWNGGRDGAWRAIALLTAAERAELTAMAWSPLGDPFEHLQRRHGIPVMRVHTAYLDWKRSGLVDQLASDAPPAGEGLALFLPAPWAAFAPSTGSRNLHYHLGSIVLAGATAWEPALEPQARIRPTLAALAGHPVLRPGLVAIAHRQRRSLTPDGLPPVDDGIAWPDQLATDDWRVDVHPRRASEATPVRWPVEQEAVGVSVLAAATISHSAELKLRHTVNRHAEAEQQAIAWMVLRYADGTEARRPLEYGEDLYALDADPRANSMWRAADVVPLASKLVASDTPAGRDLRLYRLDMPANPDVKLVELSVEQVVPGVHLTLGGAAVLLP